MSRVHGRGRELVTGAVALVAAAAACFDPGEPTESDARITWAAYPDTVVAGEPFALEVAGPLAPNTCSRFDSLLLDVSGGALTVTGRRLTYREAWCTDDRVSFYDVREVVLPRAGRYAVRTGDGVGLGGLLVLDTGEFSRIRAQGEGTVRTAGGCLFFGPGWAHGQRPFPIRNPPERVRRVADTDTVVHLAGDVRGFVRCGGYGTRPAIRVDSARVTDRTGDDWF